MARSIVDGFLAEGDTVIAADREPDLVDMLRRERPDVISVVADVTTEEGLDAAIAACKGRVDVLCNHCGVGDKAQPLDELSDAEWTRCLETNLTAPFMLCQRVIGGMLARGGGVIVNTGSVAGLRGARGGAAYTASKWALVGLTQNIAATFGSRGIRCNAVCPGPTGDGPPAEARPDLSERASQLLGRDTQKPARGDPALIASLVVFLASAGAARINGALIPADDGWIAY
jgi:NAD(P)-dependent dehydrogenase (short-subunit alcohol dehydrogenase family)